MEKYILSVIVPVYNPSREKLSKCLDSINKHSFDDIETLIICDGTSADLTQYIKEYCHNLKNITIYEQDNQGVSQARNKGIDLAKGKYLHFCDSDDEIDIFKMHEIVNKIDTDFVYFDYYKKRNDKLKLFKLPSLTLTLFKKRLLSKPNIYGTIWNKIYKKEIIIENNIYYDKELTHLEDTEFVFKYLDKSNSISHYDAACYTYCVYPSSEAKNNTKALNSFVKALNIIKDKYAKKDIKQFNNGCLINLILFLTNYIYKNNTKYNEGINDLNEIVNTTPFKEAIKNYDKSDMSILNTIFIETLRLKLYYLSYLIIKFRHTFWS